MKNQTKNNLLHPSSQSSKSHRKTAQYIYCLLLLISLASATPLLEFQHEQIQPGETILATIITEEFIEQIQQSDIKFYEGRKQIFLESDITFYNNTHYLYVYTTRPGNFSIQITDILYKESDQLKSTTITKQFNVTTKTISDQNTNTTSTKILSIKPGFIFTTQNPTIKLINKGTSILNLTYNENTSSLNPLSTHEITTSPTQTFSHFGISSYKEFSIPIIYLGANATFKSPSIQPDLKYDPEIISAELFTNNKTQKTIQLFNFGNENITNIQVTSNLSIIQIEYQEEISPRGIQNITITITPENPGHFQSYINITYIQNTTQHNLTIPLNLFILPEGTSTEDFEISEETCEEISGTICTAEETCEGEATFTKNAEYCCLGLCQPITKNKSETNYNWLIALIIFAILGAFGYLFYKKQKKITPKKPEEQMKEISEKFKTRMTGQSSRTTGKLTKS